MTIQSLARKFFNSASKRVKFLLEAYLLRNQVQTPVKVERGLLLTSKSMIEKLNQPSKVGYGLNIPVRCFPKNSMPFELTCIVPFKKEDKTAKSTVQPKASVSGYNIKRPVVRMFHSATAYTESSETPVTPKAAKDIKPEESDEGGLFQRINKLLKNVLKDKIPEKEPGATGTASDEQSKTM